MPVKGLTTAEAEKLRSRYGFNEVKTQQLPEWKKILWRYLDWVSLVILAAAVISIAVPVDGGRGWTSFVLLILELNLIVWVGYYSDRNAGNAVKELEALTVPTAHVKRDGAWKDLPARELVPGDLIGLKGGDVIPADSKLVGEGEPLLIDESSLTGESLAVTRRPGDRVLAGATITQGELDAVVKATGRDSFFGKTIALLGVPDERGHLQRVLGRVSVALALIALLGVAAIFVVLVAARGASVAYAIVTVFVIFVSVVPIGMPVVTTTVLAVGAREMAAEKAIVSRLSALEELSGMEVLASDKTGTLTLNELTLDRGDILAWGSASQEEVLLFSSLSAKWVNNDAIDKAVTGAMGGDPKAIASYKIAKFIPFNPVDKKTMASVVFPDGTTIETAKGAPQIIRDMLSDPAAQTACDTYIAERGSRGLRSLGVAKSADAGASWTLVGLISLLDPPRPDSAETIRAAQNMGVEVKMVTGDQLAIAIETSRRLGLGVNIMEGKELLTNDPAVSKGLAHKVNLVDGFAGVYPEHKFLIVEALQAQGRLVGMTGDGVNDAPALKRANVGIAVAGATDAAKAAADIILTQEGISTIITAIRRSRMIFRRLETYIIYRMASSLLILGFFFFAIIIFDFEMPTWVLVLISLFNDLSVMATSYDKVNSSDMPELWNMTKDLTVAAALAAVGIAGTVLLYALVSPTRINWWPSGYGVEPTVGNVTSGQVVAVMFLALVALIQLNILLTRTHSFFWRFGPHTAPRPSLVLLTPVAGFLLAATFVAVYWPANIKPDGGIGNMDGAGWVPILITWGYVLGWWLLADLVKVGVQAMFRRQEEAKEQAKRKGEAPPAWASRMDLPGEWAQRLSDRVESAASNAWVWVRRTILRNKKARRSLNRQEFQSAMAMSASSIMLEIDPREESAPSLADAVVVEIERDSASTNDGKLRTDHATAR